jgi:CDP-diacylglycerol--glycerol-3-phosphate 3-phosphatidyltransferase
VSGLKLAPRLQAKAWAARWVSGPSARLLVTLRVSPNAITMAGLAIVGGAAWLIADGRLLVGGIVMLAGATLDLLDGAVARLSGSASKFGAYLDSVADRVSEAAVLLGLLAYFIQDSNDLGAYLAFSAVVVSTLVSYSRARAEGLGISGDVGFMGRPERVVVLGGGLLAGYPVPALGVIVAIGSITVLQRLIHVWRATR